ncbi:uncharacterized protein LOC126680089 [Mercurialis annua]|uniref:uncharacterized protein LOC126680089 n=1 Tax=Mercurialis annua TaxID=3986 RepID=UPI00215EE9AA|nr:uncharacterized protein LOC126680089 [Mercurialis annua]
MLKLRSIFSRQHRKNNDANNNNNNGNTKVLPERRCFSTLSLNEDEEGDSDVVNENSRLVVRKYSYFKLPQQLFKLNVLKLDGSSFDVNIGRNATVAELKLAVEKTFSSSPEEGCQDKISWVHVWGHFCLSYQNQKLLNDKACIRDFGIKDGDQLQFVRHMSIRYPKSRQPQNQNVVRKLLLPSGDTQKKKEQQTNVDHSNPKENEDDNSIYSLEDEEEIPMPEFKLAHFLKGWLSYSKLWGTSTTGSRRGSHNQNRPSRFSLQCLGGRPKMIKLQS